MCMPCLLGYPEVRGGAVARKKMKIDQRRPGVVGLSVMIMPVVRLAV